MYIQLRRSTKGQQMEKYEVTELSAEEIRAERIRIRDMSLADWEALSAPEMAATFERARTLMLEAKRRREAPQLTWRKSENTRQTYRAQQGNHAFTADRVGRSWRLRGWTGGAITAYVSDLPTLRDAKNAAQKRVSA